MEKRIDLYKLLLEENAATWKDSNWQTFKATDIETEICVIYLSSICGPRFEVWTQDGMVEMVGSLDRVIEVIDGFVKK